MGFQKSASNPLVVKQKVFCGLGQSQFVDSVDVFVRNQSQHFLPFSDLVWNKLGRRRKSWELCRLVGQSADERWSLGAPDCFIRNLISFFHISD